MEGFKGTPGPWTAVKKYADEPLNVVDGNGFKVVSAERFAILDGWDEQGFTHWGEDGGHRELPTEECAANSRLIAAAPELLAALIEARVWVQGWNAANESEESYKALKMCNKAISKALGQ